MDGQQLRLTLLPPLQQPLLPCGTAAISNKASLPWHLRLQGRALQQQLHKGGQQSALYRHTCKTQTRVKFLRVPVGTWVIGTQMAPSIISIIQHNCARDCALCPDTLTGQPCCSRFCVAGFVMHENGHTAMPWPITSTRLKACPTICIPITSKTNKLQLESQVLDHVHIPLLLYRLHAPSTTDGACTAQHSIAQHPAYQP